MTWKVQLDAEFGFIQIVHTGTITAQEARNATVEALRLATGHGPHLFLADVLNADSELATLDIYDVPDQWNELGADQRNKMALVVREGGKIWSDAEFYETVCLNRGWNVKIFASLRPAIDWLTGR